MAKLLYSVMYKEHSEFLGSGAIYADDKVLLKGLTETEIAQYNGLVNRIDALGFNPVNDADLDGLSTEQLTGIIDQLITQEPNKTMGVLSLEQGRWLYDNHEAIKPQTTNL